MHLYNLNSVAAVGQKRVSGEGDFLNYVDMTARQALHTGSPLVTGDFKNINVRVHLLLVTKTEITG